MVQTSLPSQLPPAVLARRDLLPDKPAPVTLTGQYVRLEPLVVARDAQPLFVDAENKSVTSGDRNLLTCFGFAHENPAVRAGHERNVVGPTHEQWRIDRAEPVVVFRVGSQIRKLHRMFREKAIGAGVAAQPRR